MKKLFAAVAVATIAFSGSALAAEAKGVLKSINNRTIVVQTNNAGLPGAPAGIEPVTVTITVPAAAAGGQDMLLGLAPGMTITVEYTTAGTGATATNTASKVVK